MYKKKNKNIYVIVSVLFIVALLLGFLSYLVTTSRKLSFVESAIKDGTLFLVDILTSPIDYIKEKMNENSEQKRMYENYKDYQQKASEYDLLLAEKMELEKEIKDMKELLKLEVTLEEKTHLNGTVINRNIGYWYQNITVNKGKKNGVEDNMAVISPYGLIGRTTKTSNFNTTVELLTSENFNSKVSIKIEQNGDFVYGLLSGYDADKKVFIVEGIADNVEIEPGAIVTTTGLGSIYPSGILVGKVSGVTTDNFDLGKIIEVKSDVNFDNLSYVTILKREASE